MTQDRMQFSELLEKAGADDIVCEMIGVVAQRLMDLDLDVVNRCGAAHQLTQWLSRSELGYACRHGCAAHPEVAHGQLLPPSWSPAVQPRRRLRR